LYYKIYKLLEGWENIKEIRDRRRNESIVWFTKNRGLVKSKLFW
jgi:hypothetical protein